MQILNKYREPRAGRSLLELAITALPFIGLWVGAWLLYSFGYWWASLLIAVPASAFLVRLFIIQHDCGHGAFLNNRVANDWIGRTLGVLTMTPYDYWRRSHAIHHATCGDLDRRGVGDIDTLTVREYAALSWLGRLKYRAYRHPFVLFIIGPLYMFLLQQRLPVGFMKNGWRPWVSTQATNISIALAAAVLIWLIGYKAFLLVHLPIVTLAAMAGVWLFYVQHQFEHTLWAHNSAWTFSDAALHGSSFYDLPQPLSWITGYIGMHHVHHLCSRIPFYRLPEVMRDYPDLRKLGRVTLRESVSCARLCLWDEQRLKLVTLREARLG